MKRILFLFFSILCFATTGEAQLLNGLGVYKQSTKPLAVDWLLDNSSYKANVYRSEDNKSLILANGLIKREFRIGPNLATVAFDNLINQQAMLRAVRPEALVTINGIDFEVGGLTGQINHAFILPEWIDKMVDNPASFHYTGFSVGNIEKRMEWKKVRHYDENSSWPPKGISLRLNFALPENCSSYLDVMLNKGKTDPGNTGTSPALPSEFRRKPVLLDNFDNLSEKWLVRKSASHVRSSFDNEGKLGEIYTPANSAVFVEQEFPVGAKLVEATFNPGTDNSTDFGPGIALVFDNNSTIKFYIRPKGDAQNQSPALGLFDGKETHLRLGNEQIDIAKAWTLRIREEGQMLFFDACIKDGSWKNYYAMKFDASKVRPVRIRLGKTGADGGRNDGVMPGELVRLHVEHFAAYSELIDEGEIRLMSKKIEQLKQVKIAVIYDLYDGIPSISKRIEVENSTGQTITVDRFSSEILALVESSSWVEFDEKPGIPKPDMLHVETDYSFDGLTWEKAQLPAVRWQPDPLYSTQVEYQRKIPCLLVVGPTIGPSQDIKPGSKFKSFTTFELAHSSTERDRRGLGLKQMYRTVSPWITENPLMMHLISSNPEEVRNVIDQCAEVGFEMLILSFGSKLDMENENPDYIRQWKEIADYAHSKHVEIGAYSLFASRSVGGGNDVVPPKGTSPRFRAAPSLTSEWGINYYRKIKSFLEKTGFSLLEHDGPYPGDIDIAPRPPLQKGELDSRWVQWSLTDQLYKWCRSEGIYLNTPDWYYQNGSNKCTMGYREANWSLPRAHQVLHTRQNIYDGSWDKTPSMGWMFVPLSMYHGGGAAATIEPLNEHLDHYERMLYSNLALGVQACYRGPRLYDTEATKKMVKKWVDWFKKYRGILESDMVHGVRANGRDIDWMLHVNPKLNEKGMLVVFNPLKQAVTRTIKVPMYYTGLTKEAMISEKGDQRKSFNIGADGAVEIEVTIGAESMNWYVIQ